MLRAAALSLIMLFSLALVLPVTYTLAQGDGRPAVSRRNKHIRRHSRAWWRRYRARLARKRAERARQTALAAWGVTSPSLPNALKNEQASANAFAATGGIYNDPRGQFTLTLPRGWSNRPLMAGSEMRFRIFNPEGRPAGMASLMVVGTAVANNGAAAMLPARTRRQMLAGVPHADLRRIVIDKMIAAGGWVVNDFSREIGGRNVFIVTAQSPASPDGRTPEQFWQFYFAEVDGRIYSLSTNAPQEFSDRMAQEAEQALTSMRSTQPVTGQKE